MVAYYLRGRNYMNILQKMEKKEGFKEKGKGELFFRNGKIGAWKDKVPINIIRKIEKLFHKEMTELGYL